MDEAVQLLETRPERAKAVRKAGTARKTAAPFLAVELHLENGEVVASFRFFEESDCVLVRQTAKRQNQDVAAVPEHL
jgi:hypothetical protein